MLDKISSIQSVILKSIAIVGVALLVLWIGFSAYGNWSIGHQALALVPPSASKARYQFDVTATRQTYLTNDYSEPRAGVYRLNGYYYMKSGKWVYSKSILNLDTYYWGQVVETTR